jgi:large subunit ribosomal protein L28
MAFKCDFCGKGIMYGHNVSHSKRRTNRIFKPNLQSRKMVINGVSKKMKVCTNCLKLMNKRVKEAQKAADAVVASTEA